MHSAIRKTLVHPRTGIDLAPLGFRKDGRAIWPVLGAGPEEDAAAKAVQDKADADAKAEADAKAAADAKAKDEKPAWYASMSDEAKAEYDKIKSEARKHEGRWKDLKTQADKDAAEVEKLRQASLSDHQREVEAAQKAGEQEATRRMAPQLLASEFRTQLAERHVKFDAKIHGPLLESFDPAKFLAEDGTIDAAKVAVVVAPLGGAQEKKREVPGVLGLGRQTQQAAGGYEAGRELYDQQKKFPAGAGTAARDWSK